jgi:hypothetical protein
VEDESFLENSSVKGASIIRAIHRPDDRGSTHLRNIGLLQRDYTVSVISSIISCLLAEATEHSRLEPLSYRPSALTPSSLMVYLGRHCKKTWNRSELVFKSVTDQWFRVPETWCPCSSILLSHSCLFSFSTAAVDKAASQLNLKSDSSAPRNVHHCQPWYLVSAYFHG